MRVWFVLLFTAFLSMSAIAEVERSESSSSASSTEVAQSQQNEEALDEYLLGTGDRIDIIVYGEPDMSMKFKVNKSGVVNFPYIGEVKIAGRTISEIEQEIEERLRGNYLINPMVTITMESFRLFYVTGEVTSPNGYEYHPALTVEQAIAMAGGFTDRADRDDIDIRQSGSKELIEDVELTHPVQPGDIVIIEQSFF